MKSLRVRLFTSDKLIVNQRIDDPNCCQPSLLNMNLLYLLQCKCPRGPPGPSGPRGPPGAEMTEARLMAKFRDLIRGM